MKHSLTFSYACALLLMGASSVFAVDYTIYPTSPQDGILWTGVGVDGKSLGFGIWGFVNGSNYVQAGIHTLPAITPANVGCAVLRIPNTDTLWSSDGANILTMNWYAEHFDALNDSGLTNGDELQPSLGQLGLYRAAGPRTQDLARYTEITVTAAVIADLQAGRASFAWRLKPEHSPDNTQINSQMYFPTVDGGSLGFPPENTGARLIIYQVCPFEGNCSNGLDDDHDGKTDCSDSDCSNDVVCPEVCNDGIDNNADGKIDCADPKCKSSPLCPETNCNNLLDDDGDGKIDCADSDCASSSFCPENCTDGIDNNADNLIDCADPKCANFPSEPCKESQCSDGIDGDHDGQTDCNDSDCTGSFACVGHVMIQPGVPQDGPIYGGSAERNWPYGWWGAYNSTPMVEVGIHTLPIGLTAAQVGTAVLRIPRTDNPWQGDEALDLTMLVKHIDATNDAQIEVADKDSVPLNDIGIYREPGPYVPDNSRYIEFRVTDAVKADLTAGRATFAWRVIAESLGDVANSYRYMPTVENTDVGAFGDNHGAKLFIYAPGKFEDSCTDHADNDGDGLVDCNDPDCTSESAVCHEVCNDGIDNNADGKVDCADPQCLSSPACPETLCGDGIDNDQDGKPDCADSDCFGSMACHSEAGYCNDNQDNDNDCLTDAADPDCAGIRAIRPTNNQDGPLYGNTFAEPGAIWGWWGTYDGGPMVMVGMHTIPPGTTTASVEQAILRLPRHDLQWTADESALNLHMIVNHIDAANDATISAPDKASAPLGLIGTYRDPGAFAPDNTRFIEYDVTALLKADITAGRATFAWRIETDSPIAPGSSSHRYFPTVNDTVTAPLSNRSTLFLRIAGQYESSCTDGVDNDGDGRTDCADADCYNDAACNLHGESSCADGVDNDNDGKIDCEDTDCLFNSCCAAPLENCTNGVDDDGDGNTDCADSDCHCAPNCGPWPAEICGNGQDDDCDGSTDCADSECSARPECRGCHQPFADMDGDGDVDQIDFGKWQECVTGLSGQVVPGCECADWDGNGKITQADYARFELCLSGPSIQANPACDD